MKITEKLKIALKSILSLQLGKIATDKAELIFDGDELAEGIGVYVLDSEGNAVAAEDGEYTAEDGKVIKVVEGKVAEIVEAEKPAEEPAEMSKTFMSRMAEKFSESYGDKERKIYDAVCALGFGYPYIVDCGDDFAVIDVWANDTEKFYKFDITWNEEGNAVASNMVEVKPAFVPTEEPATEEPATEEPAAMAEEEQPADEPETSEVSIEDRVNGLEEKMQTIIANIGDVLNAVAAIENKVNEATKPAEEPIEQSIQPANVEVGSKLAFLRK